MLQPVAEALHSSMAACVPPHKRALAAQTAAAETAPQSTAVLAGIWVSALCLRRAWRRTSLAYLTATGAPRRQTLQPHTCWPAWTARRACLLQKPCRWVYLSCRLDAVCCWAATLLRGRACCALAASLAQLAPEDRLRVQAAFLDLDAGFQEQQARIAASSQSTAKRRWPGSTAVAALLHRRHLWVANAGAAPLSLQPASGPVPRLTPELCRRLRCGAV